MAEPCQGSAPGTVSVTSHWSTAHGDAVVAVSSRQGFGHWRPTVVCAVPGLCQVFGPTCPCPQLCRVVFVLFFFLSGIIQQQTSGRARHAAEIPSGETRGEPGATALGGRLHRCEPGLDPQPRSGGVCPHHPPPHPHLPVIRCCRKSPCTGTGCLKPLCPDNAEESQRFRARGGPRPLGLGRPQWGERAGEGVRAPPLWGPEPTLGTLGCWGLLAPSLSRQHGHGGHPDPVPEQEVVWPIEGGWQGPPPLLSSGCPARGAAPRAPMAATPPCPSGTASSGSPPPLVSVSCFSRGGNARTGLSSADYIP